MTRYSRVILQLAAAAAIVAVLPMASVAVAAENTAVDAAIAKTAMTKTTPTKVRHHAWRRTWVASHHHPRYVIPVASRLGCSGEWCGRQFVLMIGIGY